MTADLLYFARAAAYRSKQKYPEVVADLDKAIAINPNNSEYYNMRAIAEEGIDLDNAFADFAKAIEIDPDNWRAWHNRSLADAVLKHDGARAKADQAEADRLHPPEKPATSAEPPPAPPKVEARAEPPPPSAPVPIFDLDPHYAPPPMRVAEAEPPPPASSPPALRTPAHFDCVNGRHMGTDYVICASPQLLDAEARLEDAYAAARAGANGDQVKAEQFAWMKRYGPDCGLPFRGRPSDDKITSAVGCVGEAIQARIKELQAVP